MSQFAYLSPDHVLTISPTGRKSRSYRLLKQSEDNLRRLATVLNGECYQKSVELADDLMPTVYFFRVEPFVIPPEFDTTIPVELHGFTSSDALLPSGA